MNLFEDAITVGVTGHRFLAELGKVTAAVDRGLRILRDVYPWERLIVLSQLAEGADRLVARRAMLNQSAELVAVLPMEIAEYQKDFHLPAAIEEFERMIAQAVEVKIMPPSAERNESYAAAGIFILSHCDILFAIWDGNQAQGIGGTGEIVCLARQQRKPLCWVHAGNRIPGTNLPLSLGRDQGRLTFERF